MKNIKPTEPEWATEFYNNLIGRTDKQIAARLQKRKKEMECVYIEIERQLSCSKNFPLLPSGYNLLRAIIDSAALYDPNAIYKQREIKKNLIETEQNIDKSIRKLLNLLEQRSELETKGVIISGADLHLASLIESVLESKHCLETLKFTRIANTIGHNFPSLQEILNIAAAEITANEPTTIHPEDYEILLSDQSSQKTTYHDIHKRLRLSLMEMKRINQNQLPKSFKFSRTAYAAIIKCTLDLPKDVEVDETAISHAVIKKVKIQRKKVSNLHSATN